MTGARDNTLIDDEPESSLREEIANALTHGLGAVVGLGAGAVLITLTALWGDGWQLASAIVFSVALVLLYVASTLYHAITHPGAKARLKVFDHCAIYLLIAGTYTPFTLIGLRPTYGWLLFAAIWALALAGIVFKLFFTGRFKGLSTAFYIAMGWLVILAIGPLMDALDTWTLAWLFGGGVAYTAGTTFYMSRRIPYAHTIWHAFVLTGSICHFLAVTSHVLP
ncbi:PAQR family membrane homeostasis protein TrhA [Chiayiivirga flava]|uniref:Hemolysin III n=1 Tax=Chiayiivirga flava TaxID=659595 RepID=A0A7W8D6K2_9GAMM|nr:hemolysin III family protein [Chiayiivirga flava]MBB5208859.1 hemolysin III [Chiayiivirga flava]